MAKRTPTASDVKTDKRALTTTSYAILGLLSIKRWSAYELTQQMSRSLRFHWPRAQSRVYMEAPNLVAHGLAKSTEDSHGARKRTVYSITPRGRAALRAWVAEPSATPRLEAEALVRSMFADSGTKADLLGTLENLREQASAARAQLVRQGADYLVTGGPFPARLHLIALNGRFLLAFTQLLQDWAQWATEEVATWDSTGPLEPDHDRIATFRHVIGDDLVHEIQQTSPPHAM